MRVLVAGCHGQVAQSLVSAAAASDAEVVALGRPEFDLTVPGSIAAALHRVEPQVVANAAAYTGVDKAEQETEAALAVNAAGVGELAKACAAADVPLIHISTDYVFDGTKSSPYVESDQPAPLGVYGHSKLEGERNLAAYASRHIILRTAWVVSPYSGNFVKTMLRLAATRSELGVVDDQIGSPTYAPHLAEAIFALARSIAAEPSDDFWGVYHAAGTGEATWCEVAREVFRQSRALGGPAAEVKAITTAEYPTPARRPANSRLDCSKLRETFGLVLPPWQEGLAACVRALLEAQDHASQ